MIDLDAEWEAALTNPVLDVRWPVLLGRLPIVTDIDGRWQPHPAGARAPRNAWRTIVPVRWGFVTSWIEQRGIACSLGYLIELLACDADLTRFRPRGGDAEFAGPIEAVSSAEWDEPVPLFRSVAEWVRAEGAGLLPLVPLADCAAVLRGIPAGLVCRDLAHGEAVRRAMRGVIVPPVPRVLVAA